MKVMSQFSKHLAKFASQNDGKTAGRDMIWRSYVTAPHVSRIFNRIYLCVHICSRLIEWPHDITAEKAFQTLNFIRTQEKFLGTLLPTVPHLQAVLQVTAETPVGTCCRSGQQYMPCNPPQF